jgi:hypothetical protein
MDEYTSVSLDRYWNYIGVPYFLAVLVFALFVLFSVGGATLSSETSIQQFMRNLKQRQLQRGVPAAAAAPTAGATTS